jgi:hypothetical protein
VKHSFCSYVRKIAFAVVFKSFLAHYLPYKELVSLAVKVNK